MRKSYADRVLDMFNVVEATIADLRSALESGDVTAVELVNLYLARIEKFDGPQTETKLNAVVVRNENALREAQASDERREHGQLLSPLDGIPYTTKDSYMVKGLSVAAGSPAFTELIAQKDAYVIERLRAAGAICLGLTNMPPMANGGMQRGAYGRAESPYNEKFLTAPFASGSSNGSGTATAASFASFGLGTETWSSGRGPATNNSLCAYTPTIGYISVRGVFPLVPTQDVVVPHTRTMPDMLELLNVIVADDSQTAGDFWRAQPWIVLPKTSAIRPHDFSALSTDKDTASKLLAGKRFGIPKMYINKDPLQGTGDGKGMGGSTGQKIDTRQSIVDSWEATRVKLESLGAEVIEVDFPAVTNYEGDRPGAPKLNSRGLVSDEYLQSEIVDLCAWAWNDYLVQNNDPHLNTLANVDGTRIFPHPEGALPDRYIGFDDDLASYPQWVKDHPGLKLTDIPYLEEGLKGLRETYRLDVEVWMDELALDAVLMPTVADIAPADMDVNKESADIGWRNGVWVANGNIAMRHLGIPSVTIPMGFLEDIKMPIGLTIAGRAFDDSALLQLGCAIEAVHPARVSPPRTAN